MENNLRKIRESIGLTQEIAAEKMGTTRSQYMKLEKGERRLSDVWIDKAASAFGVSPGAIIDSSFFENGKQENPAPHEPKLSQSSPLKPIEVTFTSLPIAGKVAAGFWRSCDYLGDVNEFEMMTAIMNPNFPQEAQFMLEVEGESLNKLAPNGSHLHCVKLFDAGIDPNNLEDGQLVIVQRTRHQFGEFEMTAKRIRKNGDFELWPESDKPEFQEPIRVADFLGESDETIEIIAIVTAIIKKP